MTTRAGVVTAISVSDAGAEMVGAVGGSLATGSETMKIPTGLATEPMPSLACTTHQYWVPSTSAGSTNHIGRPRPMT